MDNKLIQQLQADLQLITDDNQRLNNYEGGVAYHCTSFEAFKSIIKSKNKNGRKELWLTRYDKLNDPSEFEYPKGIILKEIKRLIARANKEKDVNFRAFLEDFRPRFINVISQQYFEHYLFSLCYKHPNRHIWKTYGDNFRGVAVGFRIDTNTFPDQSFDIVLDKVVYNTTPKHKSIVGNLKRTFSVAQNTLKNVTTSKEVFDVGVSLACPLISQMPIIKDNKCKDSGGRDIRLIAEEELRVMVINQKTPNASPKLVIPDNEEFMGMRSNKYHSEIPFVKLPYNKEAIAELWIGSACENKGTIRDEIIFLLDQEGFDVSKIQVKFSEVTRNSVR